VSPRLILTTSPLPFPLTPPSHSFVDAVKIEHMTIGRNAFWILNMRALPDQPTDSDYPKDEWIDQGDREAALDPNRRSRRGRRRRKRRMRL
jgi:hypothetical protein